MNNFLPPCAITPAILKPDRPEQYGCWKIIKRG